MLPLCLLKAEPLVIIIKAGVCLGDGGWAVVQNFDENLDLMAFLSVTNKLRKSTKQSTNSFSA